MIIDEVLMTQEGATGAATRTCSYVERDPITGEITYQCGQTYPLTEQFFTKQERYAGGFKRWCRDCERRHAQRYYQRHAERARLLLDLRERLEQELGRSPTASELAERLPASNEDIERLYRTWREQQEQAQLSLAYEQRRGQGHEPTVEEFVRETGIAKATVQRLIGAVVQEAEIHDLERTYTRLQQEQEGRAPDSKQLAEVLGVSRAEAQTRLDTWRERAAIGSLKQVYTQLSRELSREPTITELQPRLPTNSTIEETGLSHLLEAWRQEQTALGVGKVFQQLSRDLGRPPRVEELAAQFEAKVEDVEQLTKFASYGAEWEQKNKPRRNKYRNDRFKKHQQAARLEKLFSQLTQLVSQRGYRCEARLTDPEKQITVYVAVRDSSDAGTHTVRIILGESPSLLPLSFPQLYQHTMQEIDRAEQALTEQRYRSGDPVFWVEQVGDESLRQPGEITDVNASLPEVSYHVEGRRSNGIEFSVWVNSTEIEPREK